MDPNDIFGAPPAKVTSSGKGKWWPASGAVSSAPVAGDFPRTEKDNRHEPKLRRTPPGPPTADSRRWVGQLHLGHTRAIKVVSAPAMVAGAYLVSRFALLHSPPLAYVAVAATVAGIVCGATKRTRWAVLAVLCASLVVLAPALGLALLPPALASVILARSGKRTRGKDISLP